MNREEAEAYVYQFYMEKSSRQDYHAKDKDKRHPEFTRELIKSMAGTPCVVVTGSKGKGSTANMISRILQTEYKVGLMTSPHISNFCERFRINGEQISDERFAEEMTFIKKEIDEIAAHLKGNEIISPMGIQTALALQYFKDEHTEFNVLECGKGAKYDDVNNALHQYSVITPIFPEHLRELGDTVEEIAEDKSHVIREGQQAVYIAKQEPSVMEILLKRAAKCHVRAKVYGEDFRAENIKYTEGGMQFDVVLREQASPILDRNGWNDTEIDIAEKEGTNNKKEIIEEKSDFDERKISGKERRYENLQIPLLGEHQAENCALALALCADLIKEFKIKEKRSEIEQIRKKGNKRIEISEKENEKKEIKENEIEINGIQIENVRKNLSELKWDGRMEIISRDPFILLDACITRESCRNVKKVLKELDILKVTAIIGIPDDKDYLGVVEEIAPVAERIILTKSQNPHYVFTRKQETETRKKGFQTLWTDSVGKAMEEALDIAGKEKLPVVILGTTSVISEILTKTMKILLYF